MRVLTGTSGFSYRAWRGAFYPADLGPPGMLAYYAARLPTVEANATFYRMPRPETLASWRAQVPPGFVFAVKAPQRITHVKRLRDVDDAVAAFHRAALALGPALGPVLYQLPPAQRKDLPRLQEFLARLPEGAAAFEFRHASWFADDVYASLAERGAALCLSDTDDGAPPTVATARFGYLRLRRSDYDDDLLRAWAARILSQPWTEALVYFKHEDAARGPALALALRDLLGRAAAVDAPATGPLQP